MAKHKPVKWHTATYRHIALDIVHEVRFRSSSDREFGLRRAAYRECCKNAATHYYTSPDGVNHSIELLTVDDSEY